MNNVERHEAALAQLLSLDLGPVLEQEELGSSYYRFMVTFALRAIKDYQKLKPSDNEWNASRRWLMSTDTQSPLSFIHIMEVLGIDAATARAVIQEYGKESCSS